MKNILLFSLTIFFLSVPAVAQTQSQPIERLQKIYEEQQTSYPPEKLQEIASRCPDSQKRLYILRRQNSSHVIKRLTIYSDLQKEMKALELRLAKQGADASELDLLIGKHQVALDSLDSNYKSYDILLSDLISINCVENQNLYASGIAELYVYQKKLRDSVGEVYNLLFDSPNTTFKPLAERLKL